MISIVMHAPHANALPLLGRRRQRAAVNRPGCPQLRPRRWRLERRRGRASL